MFDNLEDTDRDAVLPRSESGEVLADDLFDFGPLEAANDAKCPSAVMSQQQQAREIEEPFGEYRRTDSSTAAAVESSGDAVPDLIVAPPAHHHAEEEEEEDHPTATTAAAAAASSAAALVGDGGPVAAVQQRTTTPAAATLFDCDVKPSQHDSAPRDGDLFGAAKETAVPAEVFPGTPKRDPNPPPTNKNNKAAGGLWGDQVEDLQRQREASPPHAPLSSLLLNSGPTLAEPPACEFRRKPSPEDKGSEAEVSCGSNFWSDGEVDASEGTGARQTIVNTTTESKAQQQSRSSARQRSTERLHPGGTASLDYDNHQSENDGPGAAGGIPSNPTSSFSKVPPHMVTAPPPPPDNTTTALTVAALSQLICRQEAKIDRMETTLNALYDMVQSSLMCEESTGPPPQRKPMDASRRQHNKRSQLTVTTRPGGEGTPPTDLRRTSPDSTLRKQTPDLFAAMDEKRDRMLREAKLKEEEERRREAERLAAERLKKKQEADARRKNFISSLMAPADTSDAVAKPSDGGSSLFGPTTAKTFSKSDALFD